MKFDKNDVNCQLGLLAIGLFLLNIGFFTNRYVNNLSFTFINGLLHGFKAGLMIIGIFLFFCSLVNIIRLSRKK